MKMNKENTELQTEIGVTAECTLVTHQKMYFVELEVFFFFSSHCLGGKCAGFAAIFLSIIVNCIIINFCEQGSYILM